MTQRGDRSTHLQTLGKVRDLEPGGLVELGEVDEQLVRDAPVAVLVPEAVVVLEPVRHVVCVQQRGLGGLGEPGPAEHFDVRPGDEQDRGAAVLRCGDGVDGLVAVDGDHRVGGQEGREVLGDADGSA